MKKLSKKKWIVILIIFFILFLLKDGIYETLTFEKDLSDLQQLDIERINEIKNSIVTSMFSIGHLKFAFMSAIGVFIPILYIVIGSDYYNIKTKNIKFNIGKNNDYNKELNKLKLKLSLYASTIILLIYLIVMVIGFIFGKKILNGEIYMSGLLKENTVMYKAFATDLGYLFFIAIHIFIATLINGLLIFFLIDHYQYIKGTLIYISYMWIGSIIMYIIPFFPKFVVPMESIMGVTSRTMYFFRWIISFSGVVIPIILLKILPKNEVR